MLCVNEPAVSWRAPANARRRAASRLARKRTGKGSTRMSAVTRSSSPDGADERLQRIRVLVEQSKLYAQFLAASLEPEDGGGAQEGEPHAEVAARHGSSAEASTPRADTARTRRAQRPPRKTRKISNAGGQTAITAFLKPKSEARFAKGQESSNAADAADAAGPSDAVGDARSVLRAELLPHQRTALNWLVLLYQNGLNGILADEMGLGKTVEVIAFLAYLHEHGIPGPFLVLCPLSVVGNWVNELARFAPELGVAQYHGVPTARARLRRGAASWHVVVTSYEIALADSKFLKKVEWKFIIVDEGHRLKNVDSKLVNALKQFPSTNRMLLTGTPLQNNLPELWALLNFVMPDIFTDLGVFQQWFESGEASIDDADERGLVESLHATLRPFLLRRLKADVGLNLPPKREYVLFTNLAPLQRELYASLVQGDARTFVAGQIEASESAAQARPVPNGARGTVDTVGTAISRRRQGRRKVQYVDEDAVADEVEAEGDMQPFDDRNVPNVVSSEEMTLVNTPEEDKTADVVAAELPASTRAALRTSTFSNLLMQLRLACDSPYLFWDPFQEGVDVRIESTSGKLLLLHRLMQRLKPRHKVLVFTQFSRMLDVLEDWAAFRGYTYARLDGSTRQSDRQERIAAFNAEDSEIDLFMLTTRSGGQGVNLVRADTVVLFDSDWNPQQDLQAMDRVHRIGQTQPVLVLRLCTGETVEQSLLARAAQKLELSELVIERGDFRGPDGTLDRSRLDAQLRKHDVQYSEGKLISDADLDAILDRSAAAYKQPAGRITDNVYCVNSQ